MMLRVAMRRVVFLLMLSVPAMADAAAQAPVSPRTPPGNYRDLARHGIASLVTNKDVVGKVEYAEPRAAVAPQPGDWVVCVRSQTATNMHYFAVFIEGAGVPVVRRAVGIDRCQTDTYAPLPPPAKPATAKRAKPKQPKPAEPKPANPKPTSAN